MMGIFIWTIMFLFVGVFIGYAISGQLEMRKNKTKLDWSDEKEKSYFGNGDYVFMTEQATSHKLQIGKIVEEYFGSKANSSYYSIMFGDDEIVKIPMTEFENTAKLLRKR